MRHAHALGFLLIVAGTATDAHAQEDRPRVTPPRALVTRLYRDIDRNDDLVMAGPDSLARWITVWRRDFDGDGVGEWVVEGTRFCGTNCTRWIYRRLPDGRFTQVYGGGGVSMSAGPRRSHGWRDVREYWHMSCCEGSTTRAVFDGTRYRWRETRYLRTPAQGPGGERTVYRVTITPPAASGRRRIALDSVNAAGGLMISARHDVCGAPAGCSAPELRLLSATLPSGRACATFRIQRYDGRTITRRLCGTTVRQRLNGRAVRALVLHPTRADWGSMWLSREMAIAGQGLPGKIGLDAQGAVSEFATHLAAYYRLQCPTPYDCTSQR